MKVTRQLHAKKRRRGGRKHGVAEVSAGAIKTAARTIPVVMKTKIHEQLLRNNADLLRQLDAAYRHSLYDDPRGYNRALPTHAR